MPVNMKVGGSRLWQGKLSDYDAIWHLWKKKRGSRFGESKTDHKSDRCRSDRLNGEHSRVPHGAETLSHWLRAAEKSVALTQRLRQSLKVLTGGHCHLDALLAAEQPVFFLKGSWSGTLPLLPQSTPCDPWSTCSGSSFFQVSVASVHEGKLRRGKLRMIYSPHCCSWSWGCIWCSQFPSYSIHSKFPCFQLVFLLGLVPYLVVAQAVIPAGFEPLIILPFSG